MNTLTIRIAPALERDLEQASLREHVSKSELARRAIAAYVGTGRGQAAVGSALDQAADLVGCFSGGPRDLASSPKHLKDSGKK